MTDLGFFMNMRSRFLRNILYVWLCLTLSGCALVAKKPLEVLRYESEEGLRRGNLFVFMRGLGGSHRSFESEGLVDGVRSRGIPFDMVAPNAHFAYYSTRTLIERLKVDVVTPARERGYKHIWLVGFSMGGLGALLYAREYPADIAGVVVISPFLGFRSILREIRQAGGVSNWSPGEFNPDDDWERMLWAWLKSLNGDGAWTRPIFLGFGENDPYVEAHKLLAEIVPSQRVHRVTGSHDYKTFKFLWSAFLDHREFKGKDCSDIQSGYRKISAGSHVIFYRQTSAEVIAFN